jgi:hypothetical protein
MDDHFCDFIKLFQIKLSKLVQLSDVYLSTLRLKEITN